MKKPTEFQQAVIKKMDGHAIFNVKTGRLRYYDVGNDVLEAISELGGSEKAAIMLNVTENVIDLWIDEYFIPDIYAERINHLTGYSIQSLQQPPGYIIINDIYWPKSGFITEMNLIARDQKIQHDQNRLGATLGATKYE